GPGPPLLPPSPTRRSSDPRGADVMICMCWDLQDDLDRSLLKTGRSGTRDAGSMAARAGVKTLVLSHVEPQITTVEGREAAIADRSEERRVGKGWRSLGVQG